MALPGHRIEFLMSERNQVGAGLANQMKALFTSMSLLLYIVDSLDVCRILLLTLI